MIDRPMLDTLSVISESRRYNEWIYNQFKNDLRGCVLDIGSGIGDIVAQYDTSQVDRIVATDYSDIMVSKLKERFALNPKYTLVNLDITGDVSAIEPGSIDVITCSNVLEHIEHDVAVLKTMRRFLKPGGKLLILVPALPQIYGSLDRLVGHYRRYTKKTLSQAFCEAGFAVERQSYMNVFGVVTWFLAGRVLKRQQFDQDACKMLDRVVPFLRFIESGVKPAWGQSLVMVGING